MLAPSVETSLPGDGIPVAFIERREVHLAGNIQQARMEAVMNLTRAALASNRGEQPIDDAVPAGDTARRDLTP